MEFELRASTLAMQKLCQLSHAPSSNVILFTHRKKIKRNKLIFTKPFLW
jgi:hypothetical protein